MPRPAARFEQPRRNSHPHPAYGLTERRGEGAMVWFLFRLFLTLV